MPQEVRKLFFGDNLEVLSRHIEDESVDLIYLDPPFQSGRNYNVIFEDNSGSTSRPGSQTMAFQDTWSWGDEANRQYDQLIEDGGDVSRIIKSFRNFFGASDLLAYLVMMAPRLKELHRVLKPTGSLYLHCDPTASHYLKLLLDAVFGPKNFRSEVVWRRSSSHNKLSSQYGPIHDTIFFYTKTDDFKFHPGTTPYTEKYIDENFTNEDENGPYRKNELTGSGTRNGTSGDPWRDFDPTEKGRHWAISRDLKDQLPDDLDVSSMTSQEKLDALADMDNSRIELPDGDDGWPRYKQYVGEGIPYQDIWAYQPGTEGVLHGTDKGIDRDVRWLESGDEKLGFDTQKPEGLLERIIETSSDKGDVILDPFCGCGTTVTAAEKMERSWIGIDITHIAINLIKSRIKETFGEPTFQQTEVHGEPVSLEDARELAEVDKFEFENWVLGFFGARKESPKRGADKGIDGRIPFYKPKEDENGEVIISVKGGKNIAPKHILELKGVVEREGADIGLFVTLEEPTERMREEANDCGFYETEYFGKFPEIQIITVEELLHEEKLYYPPTQKKVFKTAKKYVEEKEQLELTEGG